MADKKYTNASRAILNIDGRAVAPGREFSLSAERHAELSKSASFSLAMMDGSIVEGEAEGEKKPAGNKPKA